MTEPHLLRNEFDHILELTLNRPNKLNAINREILDGIRRGLDEFSDRSDLRVLLIRANGRYFSAGADLSDLNSGDLQGSGARVRDWFRRDMGGMQRLWEDFELIEKPVVVAHHATCVGGGLEMSLSCDFRLAAASASYSFPEMKMGMVPASGGIGRLTRMCGPHWARWMVLASQPISAERALAMGLVHAVYPDESFFEDVHAFCRQLAGQPPEAMAVAKVAIELANDLEGAQARQVERLSYGALALGREHIEMREQHYARVFGRSRSDG